MDEVGSLCLGKDAPIGPGTGEGNVMLLVSVAVDGVDDCGIGGAELIVAALNLNNGKSTY